MRTVQLKALPPTEPSSKHWQLIRDQRVREAEVKAEIEVRRLEEDAKVIVDRRRQVDKQLDDMGESEARVKAHRFLARRAGGIFACVVVVTILMALWTLSWYVTLTWERILLALTLIIVPLIGWEALLRIG